MNLNTAYYVAATALLLWAALLWLAGLGAPKGAGPGRVKALVLGAAAAGAAVLPLGDFTLWRWCMSVHSNPSVLFVGFLAAYAGSRLTGAPWLSDRDRLVAYLLGAVAGAVLYGSATGFLRPDLYAFAWEGRSVVACAGVLAVTLIAAGNRTGILLALALAGQVVGLMESSNTWDYVIDPAFWFVSLCGLGHFVVRWSWVRLRGVRSQTA